jgi:hypothetical protein
MQERGGRDLRNVRFLPFSRALSTGNPVWKPTPARSSICLVHFFDLDDRIRELCAKVAAAREAEVEPVPRPVFFELKFALRQHAEQLRRLAAGVLDRAVSEQPKEGRCRRSVDANGRVYWTFTWSGPAQGAIRATPKRPLSSRPGIGKGDEGRESVQDGPCIQGLVQAQPDQTQSQPAE